MGEKLVLLDGYSLMYRAFFAVQGVMTAPDGTPTNAAHNFMMMLTKLIDEEKPDALAAALSPALRFLGIPPECAPLLFLRPFSGSGALAVGSELMRRYGPDSTVGRTAAVMLGSTETTFYVVGVYFGAAGIRKTRHAIPAALIADFVGFVAAAAAVRWWMK